MTGRLGACAAAALVALVGCGPSELSPTRRGDLVLSVDGGAPGHEVSFDFGAVALGGSTPVEVVATNVGLDPLTVTRLSLEGSDTGAFFVRGDLGQVLPGASTTAVVTFAPARVGAQSTRLIVEHDADAPRPAATLSGAGQ